MRRGLPMIKVFVNGISAKSGGGRSILTNFLKVARSADDPYRYLVAVPDDKSYADLAHDRVQLLPMPQASKTMRVPLASAITLPRAARAASADLVFNLSDIPLRSRLPQVFLFDWPYAAFPDSPAWNLATRKERAVRHAKLFFFKRFLPFVDVMIAQNEVLAGCLKGNYGLAAVRVVPNAVSLDNLAEDKSHDFALGAGVKLLCLSRYYSHKNIESFLPLAELIKRASADIKIITTVDAADSPGAATFLRQIAARELGDVIVNLGSVPMARVPSLYHQVDALLLPTLLESFSGTYVEAMFHQLPILTSDLPFAHGVCGAGAYYFDPSDSGGMYAAINAMLTDPVERTNKLAAATGRLAEMLTWDQAYAAYTAVFATALENRK